MIRITLFAIVLLLNTVSSHGSSLTHVNAVVQDEKRNAYFATHKGVFRFDGSNYLKLAGVTGVPAGWANAIEYNPATNTLYIAFNADGIWQLDLNTNSASQVADTWAKDLAISNDTLLIHGYDGLLGMELKNHETYPLLQRHGQLLGVAGNHTNGYAMLTTGVYMVQGRSTRLIDDTSIQSGAIAATPQGVAYFRGDTLVSYSGLSDSFIYNDTGKAGQHLTFAAPHTLHFTQNGFVKSATLANLEVAKQNMNHRPASYRGLFVDADSRLWALDIAGFEIFNPAFSITPILPPSPINVLQKAYGQYWLGTKNGLYVKRGDGFKLLDWLKPLMPPRVTITNVLPFVDQLVVNTSKGSFAVDVDTQSVKRIFDHYVINAAVVDNSLYLATDKYGIVIFDDGFSVLPSAELNKTLPDTEVLAIKQLSGGVYVATAKGLFEAKTNETHLPGIKVSDVAEIEGRIFAASYGAGLFEMVDSAWRPVPSPLFITELNVGDNQLFLSTVNGLHWLNNQHYTQMLDGTNGQYLIPGSVQYDANRILAVSQNGLLKVSLNALLQQPGTNVINYARTQDSVQFNPTQARVEINNADWVEIALTDYEFNQYNSLQYQYRFGGEQWHTLAAPIIQLNNLRQGQFTIEYRTSAKGNEWTAPNQITLVVNGPWYTGAIAYSVYLTLASLVLVFLVVYVVRRTQSFHLVFKALNRNVKHDVSEALQLVTEATTLCSGNDTEITEGLVKLNRACSQLIPVAHSHANLGVKSLHDGLGFLQANCFTNYDKQECRFDITLGHDKLTRELECDIYSVVYHGVTNALQHSQCTTLAVHVNKVGDFINVEIKDNGTAIGLVERKVNFGLGHYVITQTAKGYGTKAKWKSGGRKGFKINSVVVTFPVLQGKPRLVSVAAMPMAS